MIKTYRGYSHVSFVTSYSKMGFRVIPACAIPYRFKVAGYLKPDEFNAEANDAIPIGPVDEKIIDILLEAKND